MLEENHEIESDELSKDDGDLTGEQIPSLVPSPPLLTFHHTLPCCTQVLQKRSLFWVSRGSILIRNLTPYETAVETAIHAILYLRRVYPPEFFAQRRRFNMPVYQCHHKIIRGYVDEVVSVCAEEALHVSHSFQSDSRPTDKQLVSNIIRISWEKYTLS